LPYSGQRLLDNDGLTQDEILLAAHGNELLLLLCYFIELYQLSILCSFERQNRDTTNKKQTNKQSNEKHAKGRKAKERAEKK
jgi:hypothetical protein